MTDIEPYSVAIPDDALDDLRQRLARTRLPDELAGVGGDRGAPLADVRRLVTHWREAFDWRRAEAQINRLPRFRTRIQVDGFEPLAIHFVHRTSAVDGAIPLLFVHGCTATPLPSILTIVHPDRPR